MEGVCPPPTERGRGDNAPCLSPRCGKAGDLCRVIRTFSDEQIACALRQAELGTPVVEVRRKMGVSKQTFYRWKKKYAGLGPGELRRLRQLEEENFRLKRMPADLSVDKAMLQDVLSKKL